MSQLKAQVDKLLTNASSMYQPKNFICEKVLPQIQVKQYSGLLGKYGNSHLRIENSLKGGRGKYRRVEAITRSTTQYLIEGHGLEGFVSKEDYANVEDPFDAERDETIGLSTMLFIEKEKMLADTLASSSVISQTVTLSGTSQLSDYNNSDPISVFNLAQATIIGNCGVKPNIAIMDIVVANKIKYHPQLMDNLGFKYAKPGGLTNEDLAKALDVEQVYVADARYNSAKEGQTDVFSSVWGKNIYFAVSADKAEIMQKILGYMIRPTGGEPRKVYKQTNFNPPGSSAILVEDEYDMLIADAACAYSIINAIA